jgi:hypothetical protein
LSTIADLIVTRLRQAGVRFLFGVPGGGSNLDIIESARRGGVDRRPRRSFDVS